MRLQMVPGSIRSRQILCINQLIDTWLICNLGEHVRKPRPHNRAHKITALFSSHQISLIPAKIRFAQAVCFRDGVSHTKLQEFGVQNFLPGVTKLGLISHLAAELRYYVVKMQLNLGPSKTKSCW
jgi:hypothetical protein